MYLKPFSALGGFAQRPASHSGHWHLQGTEGSLSALQAAGCEVQLLHYSTRHRKVHLAKGTDGRAIARRAESCHPVELGAGAAGQCLWLLSVPSHEAKDSVKNPGT